MQHLGQSKTEMTKKDMLGLISKSIDYMKNQNKTIDEIEGQILKSGSIFKEFINVMNREDVSIQNGSFFSTYTKSKINKINTILGTEVLSRNFLTFSLQTWRTVALKNV